MDATKIETPVEQLKAEIATLRAAVKQLQDLMRLPDYSALIDLGEKDG